MKPIIYYQSKVRFIWFVCFISFFFSLSNVLYAQNYIAGETYFDSTGYVEYRAGNLPIILSAPHGGNWRPDSIPDRDCTGCSYGIDSYTRIITWGVYDAFFEQTGCYPHMIMNRLHRVKFDANRDIGDAADGNPLIEQAWNNYHAFVDTAKDAAISDYGRGLFLDIHGHAHTKQRIELGYLLSRSELQLSDSLLNTIDFINESSVRALSNDNVQNIGHAELLRGEDSFGTLMDDKGFPSVPSLSDPFPIDNDPYFTGGYNTVRHGSRDNEKGIDAIQIELNQDIRFDSIAREVLIDSLARVMIEYYSFHIDEKFGVNFCDLISGVTEDDFQEFKFRLYPNPTIDYFIVDMDRGDIEVTIYDIVGNLVLSRNTSTNNPIYINQLPSGYYVVRLKSDDYIIGVTKLIKS